MKSSILLFFYMMRFHKGVERRCNQHRRPLTQPTNKELIMLNHNNNTYELNVQSQTFLKIMCAGTNMASFLDKIPSSDDQQKQTISKLISNWTDVCTQYANYSTHQNYGVVKITIDDVDSLFEYLSQAVSLLHITIISEDFIVDNGYNYRNGTNRP